MGPGDSRLTHPRYLVVGRIGRAHGVRGEVRVEPLTDFPDRFEVGSSLLMGPEQGAPPRPVTVESSRPHGRRLLVRFDVTPDRSHAEEVTGQLLFVPAAEAHPLEPGDYYPHQLIGLEVVVVGGHALGQVAAILETGAADVLVVEGAGRKHLLPMIAAVIAQVDLDEERISVTPLPGMLE